MQSGKGDGRLCRGWAQAAEKKLVSPGRCSLEGPAGG